MDDRRFKAMLEEDWDALAELFGDDLLYTHGSAVTDTKHEFIENFKKKYKLKSAYREDVTVRGFGDLAIMHGRVRMEMDAEGKPRSMHNCFAAVWAKRGGRWQLVHFQPTPVPQK
jgi:ketosteroid isomerase-like protein